MHHVELTAGPLSLEDVTAIARVRAPVVIGSNALDCVRQSRAVIEHALTDGNAHYGINTGFGSLSRSRIDDNSLSVLQHNLIRSHAAGVGEPVDEPTVRAMMALLAASLCRGHSGVREQVPQRLADLLNAGIVPVVPCIGSVGASGDLAPLAHIALVLIGEGEAFLGCERIPGGAALERAGLEPLVLEPKEGLALINGTHLMAAQAALACTDFDALLGAALAAAAMSIDGCKATDAFLDPRVHTARAQPGPARVAARVLSLLSGSEIIQSHRSDDTRVQDPYSLRCIPPILGASMDAADYVKLAVNAELAAVTDNPLVFEHEPRIVSAGNFHGLPLAIPLDTLAIAVSHVAGVAERRVFWMLSARDPESGLTPYLAAQPGLQSGLMIAQYTAAACCNEIITLATPASVSNIPTSAGIEDYNSYGPRSGAQVRRAIDLARHVVAVELICAAQAIEHHRPLRSGAGVERAFEEIRAVVPAFEHDRSPSADIERVAELIAAGRFGSGV